LVTGAVRTADRRDRGLPDIGQFLSKERIAQGLAELFGVPVSAGTRLASPAARRPGSAGS